MSAQHKLDRLTKWFDDNNIKWDKDALSIKELDGSFGIFALKDMKKSDTIVKIPKEVVLSTKTCGIANILDEANLEGGCPLALAVLYEIAQKEDSPWYGYLQALPDQGEDLPMFWKEEEKEWFRGTEMESPVYNDFNDLEDDYHELIEPLLEEYPYIFKRKEKEDPYSFDKFVKASTLISSRAFEVDAFHETALVPFADLFNHRGQGEHVHFETEFQVCEACGVLEFCEHQYFNYLEEKEDEKEGGEEGEWEDEEDVEEGDETEEELDTELPDLEELEQKNVDFWDKEEEDEEKDCCDMVLDRDVQKGKEIFNTYGDHPNVALLSKYGFCYDNNKNDYVTIGENSIVDCCLAITLEILKAKHPKASKEELEMMAVEETRPRWELFLRHEHILCPTEGDDLEEGPDDFEDDCEEDCCGGGDHDHEGEGHEHVHDEDGGCCGGEEDEEEEGPSRPYFINSEGLFEDKVMCLLHIMFVSEAKLKKFTENIDNALEYFEELANSQGQVTKSLLDVKRKVYQACHALADFRRMEYFDDDGEWKSIEKDIEERKEIPEGSRKYYAMTLRISEKKIIDKAVKYYDEMVKGCSAPSAASSSNNKKQKRPNRSRK